MLEEAIREIYSANIGLAKDIKKNHQIQRGKDNLLKQIQSLEVNTTTLKMKHVDLLEKNKQKIGLKFANVVNVTNQSPFENILPTYKIDMQIGDA
jgi:hypothetical protein